MYLVHFTFKHGKHPAEKMQASSTPCATNSFPIAKRRE